jgi:hypothetical protein
MNVLEKLESGVELVDLSSEDLDELLEFVDNQVAEGFEPNSTKLKSASTKLKSASNNAFF